MAVDRFKWWRESGFGLFVHWGLYAATEGFWKGTETKGIGEWIQSREKIPLADYRQLAAQMTLADFDADAWVALAKRAGMGHVVITAKHHEGFAMYDSACSDYTIVRQGPSGRDPLAELAAACKRGGLVFCVYYSHCLDFEHPHAYGNTWDYDPKAIDFPRYVEEKLMPQVRELLTNYGPIGLIWFDMPKGLTREQTLALRALVRELQPDCLIGARLGYRLEDYHSLGDNELPGGVLDGHWETPATMNDTWGYKRDDQNWKDGRELAESLAELAACGVNYLLNIGPTASGRIPNGSVRALEELGDWMEHHGRAVVSVQKSPFPSHGDNWLATCSGSTLYVLLRSWEAELAITGLESRVLAANLVGVSDAPVVFGQEGDTLVLRLPTEPRSDYPNIVELHLDGPPRCAALPVEQPDGCVYLPGARAVIEPGTAKPQGAGVAGVATELAMASPSLDSVGGQVYNWRRPDDRVRWTFRVAQPGRFAVIVRTRGPKYRQWIGGQTLRATVGEASTTAPLGGEEPVHKPRTRYFPERGSSIGELSLVAGAHTLELAATAFSQEGDLSLTEVVLRRI